MAHPWLDVEPAGIQAAEGGMAGVGQGYADGVSGDEWYATTQGEYWDESPHAGAPAPEPTADELAASEAYAEAWGQWARTVQEAEDQQAVASEAYAEAMAQWARTVEQYGTNAYTGVVPVGEDGTSIRAQDVVGLLRSGLDLATAITRVTGEHPVIVPGRPVPISTTLPYPARVTLPNGQTVIRPQGSMLPPGSIVRERLTPAQAQRAGVAGGLGGGLVWGILGIAALAIYAKRRSG
jgi:hypothetical protein